MSPVTLADAHKLHRRHKQGHRQVCPKDCAEKRPHAHVDGRIVTIGSKPDRVPPTRHGASKR
jgi:hypothetical protein